MFEQKGLTGRVGKTSEIYTGGKRSCSEVPSHLDS